MRLAIGILGIIGLMVGFLWFQAPRLAADLRHSKDFVPAQNWKPTGYRCTNWNAVMFNECTVTYQSLTQPGVSQSFTDWRFGRAPHDGIVLLQRRNHPEAVTTDVSLRTLWNRLALAVSLLLLGGLALIGFAAKARTTHDERVASPALDRRPGTFA